MSRFTVDLPKTGMSFACSDQQTILEGMIMLGKTGIPAGCRGGGCGICKIEVLAGEWESGPMSRAHVTVEEERAGRVLACRTKPRSDLTIMVVGKLERVLDRSATARGGSA